MNQNLMTLFKALRSTYKKSGTYARSYGYKIEVRSMEENQPHIITKRRTSAQLPKVIRI